jgi:LytS/YehU family sensor histidine kinase
MEQKLLRSQLNPHFIFNSITSIQDFVLKKETGEADHYLSSFSMLIRHVLENSRADYVPVKKEIKTIENYLELQHLRFPELFDYEIKVDPDIDPEEMAIPPMLAQPFIENAVEHGIKHKKSRGKIQVIFRIHDKTIILEILDDGVGRKKAMDIEKGQMKTHKSLSTEITHERIKAMNKRVKHKIFFEINDLKNEIGEACGTKILFRIPYKIV